MWVLCQLNKNGYKIKYLTSKSYSDIVKYINTFQDTKKIDDYNFIGYNGDEELKFSIYIAENLDMFRR